MKLEPTSLRRAGALLCLATAAAGARPQPVAAQEPRGRPERSMEVRLWDPEGPCCILRVRDRAGWLGGLPEPYRPRRMSEVYAPGISEAQLVAGALAGHARPPSVLKGSAGAVFVVVYTDDAGEGFWHPELGPERRAAFEFAAAALAGTIEDDDIVISVDASMSALGTAGGNLASGSASAYYQDGDFPFPDSWYGEPLYSHLDGSDPDTDLLDVAITYNTSWDASATPWYYGLDGAPGPAENDFVSVTLHELIHGLDFVDSFQAGGGLANDDPFVFDNFLIDPSGAKLIDLPDVASTVTGDDVLWGGNVAELCWRNHLDAGGSPRMFAPTPFMAGSSLAHWDEDTFGPPWDLMTPQLGTGESTLQPDAITRGLLTDIGWKIDFEGVYVSPQPGDTATGKPHQPFGSLLTGLSSAAAKGKTELFLANGTYQVSALVIDQPVTLHAWPGVAVVE